MVGLIVNYNDKAFQQFFTKMKDIFPEIAAQALGYIGSKGKVMLKTHFLSGQELNLKAYPKDVLGHPTISYSIGKNAKYVKISSYPINLFERGRMLRSGRKERGRRIVTRKFKQYMASNLDRLANEFDSKYLQKKIDKIG